MEKLTLEGVMKEATEILKKRATSLQSRLDTQNIILRDFSHLTSNHINDEDEDDIEFICGQV